MQAIIFELRQTVGDLSRVRADWRFLARRALPVAAAAAAGTGALCWRKRSAPPDPELLAGRARFDCEPAGASLAARGLLPSPADLERSLVAAGADVAALRRAAQRMRGPIERDLLVAERVAAKEGDQAAVAARRQQLHEELVKRWREAGYDREPEQFTRPREPNTGIDYLSQEDESYGRDVGCQLPLCLLRPPAAKAGKKPRGGEAAPPASEPSSLAPEASAAAGAALQEHGVVMLGSLLSNEEVEKLRDMLRMQVSALDKRRSSGPGFLPVREYDATWLQEECPELEPFQSTIGRRHYYLRGRAAEDIINWAQAGAVPLIWDHLVRAREAAGLPESAKPYISEVQLLVTDPCAIDQFWHVDNTAPGLTLFIPLTQVPKELGPTLFLPGSHLIFGQVPGSPGLFARLRGFASSFLSSDGVVVGSMGAGDALLYDSRIVHRGAANRKYDRTRVALVFRYDFERPPGLGPAGTQCLSWTGNILAAFQRFYTALPGSSRPGASGEASPAAVGGGAAR